MINLEEKYLTRKDTYMIKILEYNGHIRNWKVLCEELGSILHYVEMSVNEQF